MPRGNLLIVDEAYKCAPAGLGKYATDAIRTDAIRMLVPHFEHKLFLTATLHNGCLESFTALVEHLDNRRLARGMNTDTKKFHRQEEAVIVRRLRSGLKGDFGNERFPKRMLEALKVDYLAEEWSISVALMRYANYGR
jgi:hypothetical protein